MSKLTTGAATATTFNPPANAADVVAEALGRIITGRPLPEGLRPPVERLAPPDTVQERIAWILAGRPGPA